MRFSLLILVGVTVAFWTYVLSSKSELIESHDLENNRRLEIYFVMSGATSANYVDVSLIDNNKFIWKRQHLLEARSVGSAHVDLMSADTAMAYIYSYGHTLTDSVVLILTGDQETIHWR